MMVNDVCIKCPFVKNKIKNPLQRKQYVDKLSFYKYLLLYKAKKKVERRIYIFAEKEEFGVIPEIFDSLYTLDTIKDNTNVVLFPHTLCMKSYSSNVIQYCYNNQSMYKKLYKKINNSIFIAFGKQSIKVIENLISVYLQDIFFDNRISINLESLNKGSLYEINIEEKNIKFYIILENKITSLKYNVEVFNKLKFVLSLTPNKYYNNEYKDDIGYSKVKIKLLSEKDLNLKNSYEIIIPNTVNIYKEKIKQNIIDFLINNPEIPYVIDVESLKPNGQLTLNWFEEDTQLWFISIAFKKNNKIISYSFPLDCPDIIISDSIRNEIKKDLKRLLIERKTGIIINHNIKFDLLNLCRYLDIDVNSIFVKNNKVPSEIKETNVFDIAKNNLVILDTIILEKILDENKVSYSLQNLATQLLGYPYWKNSLKEYSEMSMDREKYTEGELLNKAIEVLRYSAIDSLSDYELFEYEYKRYIKGLENKSQYFMYQLAFKYIPFIYKTEISLEYYGIAIDRNKLKTLREKTKNEFLEMEKQIKNIILELNGDEDVSKLNLSSRQQLAKIFKKIKIPLKKTNKGNVKLDNKELKRLSEFNFKNKTLNKLFTLLIQYYKTEKLLTSFYTENHYKFDKNNIIHPIIHINGATKTGRNTSENPNIQQLPRKGNVKSIFVTRDPENRVIIQSDHSQAELRISAVISQDKNLLEIFKKDRDPYKEMCAKVWNKKLSQVTKEERQTMKSIVLGTSYGLTAKGLAMGLKISVKKAEDIYAEFNKTFSNLEVIHNYMKQMVFKYGYVIGMTFRKRRFPFIKLKKMNNSENNYKYIFDKLYNRIKNQAINSPVQGSTSDMLSLNFAVLYNRLINNNIDVYWVNTVHDSIVLDANKKDVPKIIKLMKIELPKIHPLMIEWLKIVYHNKYDICPFGIDISIGKNLGSYDEENNPDGLKDYSN